MSLALSASCAPGTIRIRLSCTALLMIWRKLIGMERSWDCGWVRWANPPRRIQAQFARQDQRQSTRCSLRILDQRHEAEVLVLLHMTMQQRGSRIVGDEIDLDGLAPRHVHDILDDARCRLPGKADQLEAVPVQ